MLLEDVVLLEVCEGGTDLTFADIFYYARSSQILLSIDSCLFDQEIHWWMVVEVKVVDQIVLPLIVGTPFTEQVLQTCFFLF